MKRARLYLEKWGLHAFLLPVFFVANNYRQYHGLVSTQTAFYLFIKILSFVLVFFLLLWAATKHVNKSLQLTSLFVFIFLFFGVIKTFSEEILQTEFLTRYTVFLPLILIVTIILAWKILKKRNFRTSNLFLNLLLLVFLLIESLTLVISGVESVDEMRLTKVQYSSMKPVADSAEKPDVYYLIFDCYPGTTYLRNYMNYDNYAMDSMLKQDGFHVIPEPRSNYNRTAFSMASTFNFQYLRGINDNTRTTSKDYNQALLTVKDPDVVNIFKSNGYRFYNLSVFAIDDAPPMYREHFLTMPEENVMLYDSLWERIKRDVLWNFITGNYANTFIKKLFEQDKNKFIEDQVKKKTYNHTLIDSVAKIPLITSASPKFVYAHFELPHPPYFYNEKGESNNLDMATDPNSFRNRSLFLSYLEYTNTVIRNICNHILRASGNKAVIVIQSDHGFTDFEGGPQEHEHYFKNYSAFYFPDRNYSILYDSLSNINTFPILFNKYFQSNIPLQKDSTVFLHN